MAAALLIDRPGLAACLALRGVVLARAEDAAVLVGRADDLEKLRRRFPAAAILTLAPDDAGEAAAIEAGAADAAHAGASDRLIAARVARLLAPAARMRVGPLVIDLVARRAMREARGLDLLPREFALLAELARQAGRTVPHARLHRAVCGLGFHPGTNVLAVHVSRVRAQLDRGFPWPMLLTDRGAGYRLVAAPAGTG
jgi:two-component system OmpR family response regulator